MSYYRQGPYRPSGIGIEVPGLTPLVKYLIIACLAVWLLQLAGHGLGFDVDGWFGLTPQAVAGGQIWQIGTYMFLHNPRDPFHLLFNMLMLWMFGTEVERMWGTRRFLKYYFTCGIGAGLVTCATFWTSTTYGASGAVFGVMLAYAMTFPERIIYFWFIFPMRALSFVLLCAGIEVVSLLNLPDGVAHTAHLGGMLFGWLFMKRAWRVQALWAELRWRWRRRRLRVIERDRRNYPFH